MSRGRGAAAQLAVTAAAFLLAAIVGGVLWHQLVDLPDYTRTTDNGTMGALEMSRSVAIDGWYAVIGAVFAVVLGVALTLWTRRSPRLNVFATTGAAAAAGLLMLGIGRWLGPGDVDSRLAAAKVGERIPMALVPNAGMLDLPLVHVHSIFLVWPIAALLGVVLTLLLGRVPEDADAPR